MAIPTAGLTPIIFTIILDSVHRGNFWGNEIIRTTRWPVPPLFSNGDRHGGDNDDASRRYEILELMVESAIDDILCGDADLIHVMTAYQVGIQPWVGK